MSRSLENVEYCQKIEGLKAKLVETFFSLLLEQRRRDLNEQNLQLSKYIYDRANLLYKDGRISKPDLMDTEIEYLKEKNLNNELNLKAAKDKFCQLLQLPLTVDPIVSFDDSTETFKNLNIDLGKVTDCAIEYNYNMPQKVKGLGQTAQIKKISAENRPSVTLELGGGYNSQFKHFKDAYNGILSSRLASMTLSIPIYDGGAGKSRRKASEYQLKKMQDQFSIDKGDALVDYTKDLMSVNIIINGINSYKRVLGLLDQQIGVIKMKVDYGRLEVEQYLRIKRERMQAFVDYHNLIQDYYMYIYKYRSLSLIDIRDNMQIVSFSE